MFGISSGVDDDEDVSDNLSVPSGYQHFNPTGGRPKSKLGRRRLMQPKDNGGGAPKQGTQAQNSSQWQKDDSGIFHSDSTPSLTHPVCRGANANYNAKLGANAFTSAFTPSFRSNQENAFNKFALPTTPRFRSEPLKEISDLDNSMNQLEKHDNSVKNQFLEPRSSKDSQETVVQKELNRSFIEDGSVPPCSSAVNKTANETSDFSNDSSFMTCHDINIQQSNKTVYDPAFLKTPGRNLAEIRIEESPFNPLENFLGESGEFDLKGTPVSSVNDSKIKMCQNSSKVDESRYSDPLAFPLDCSNIDKEDPSNTPLKPPDSAPNQLCQPYLKNDSCVGPNNNEPSCQERSYLGHQVNSVDSEFKHPSLALLKTPHRTGNERKEEMHEHTTPSSGYLSEKSFHTEETTHVTYPQPSKSGLKNTFTSQFLNSYKPGMSNSVKVLSLANQGYEPVSATSVRTGHGLLSSHFDQGYESQSGRVIHRMGNVRDASARNRPPVPSCEQSEKIGFRDQSDELDSTVGSISSERPVMARGGREPCPGGGSGNDHDDTGTSSTNFGNDATVVARSSHDGQHPENYQRHRQCQQQEIESSNHQSKNEQQSIFQMKQNGIHAYEQHQQHQQRIMQPVGPTLNGIQFSGQQQTGLNSGGFRDPSRPQFGGQQSTLQANVYQDPQVAQHQQSRPQSAGQVQSKIPDAFQPQQTRPQSAGHPQSDSANTNSVLSALMKPEPQNVITIKGTPYTVLSLLGKGGSSQVYQALGPQSSKLMAIKCVNLASVEEAMATDYLNEIALLSKLQGCPSVIKMFDHEYVEQSQMLYVVLEKGDIDFSKLIKNISENNQISMPMILYYWSEMLSAVHEIHKRGIIHSDLKPANFLLVEGRLKLIDFGIASSIQGDTTSVMKDVPAGTYNYMSPESITGPKITRKSDVWSMGCILFNLLYGRTPFSHLNNRWQKLHAIADVNHPVTFPPLKHRAPPSLRLALRWCLNKNPALRPTVEELVTLSELSPPADSGLGKEIDGMMCQYFRRVLPNLRNLKEDSWERPS